MENVSAVGAGCGSSSICGGWLQWCRKVDGWHVLQQRKQQQGAGISAGAEKKRQGGDGDVGETSSNVKEFFSLLGKGRDESNPLDDEGQPNSQGKNRHPGKGASILAASQGNQDADNHQNGKYD